MNFIFLFLITYSVPELTRLLSSIVIGGGIPVVLKKHFVDKNLFTGFSWMIPLTRIAQTPSV